MPRALRTVGQRTARASCGWHHHGARCLAFVYANFDKRFLPIRAVSAFFAIDFLLRVTLMWLEAVLGLCLGCEIYRLMVRRGWRTSDDAYEVCANDTCDIATQGPPPDATSAAYAP